MSPEARIRGAKRSQCASKKRYRDRTQATSARWGRAKEIDYDLRIYECPFCAGFHLTKQKERGTS